jgi:hypothetical protein
MPLTVKTKGTARPVFSKYRSAELLAKAVVAGETLKPLALFRGDHLSDRPIAEAHYQHATPHDASGRNFVPKRNSTR